MTHSWNLARKLALAFALGPLAFIVIGGIAYHSTVQLLDARARQLHTYQVRDTIRLIELQMVNAQTGQRGYLLTGDNAYLQPYRIGASSVGNDLRQFATLTSDNPSQQDRARTLSRLITQKLAELQTAIRIRQRSGLAGAVKYVQTNQGKTSMDAIRSVLAAADAEENRLQGLRDAAAQRAAGTTLAVILYGTIGIAVVLAIVGVLVTRSITRPVQEAIGALASATAELLAGTAQQSSGMQEQASAVAETVSTVEEITQTAEQSNERAKAVAESARRVATESASGRSAVEGSIGAMAGVKVRTESIAQSILALAEQAQAIGEITSAVADIAEQTNLLALNAAIEASRAGEQGRGFAVVAAEIRSLAEQSKKSTAQVRQILGEIQRATNSAVMATEEGTKSVDEASRSVTQAGETIRALAAAITEASQAAVQISASVGQQAIGMSQIRQAMTNINQATTQNLASTRQAEQAARDLDGVGVRLRTLLVGAAT